MVIRKRITVANVFLINLAISDLVITFPTLRPLSYLIISASVYHRTPDHAGVGIRQDVDVRKRHVQVGSPLSRYGIFVGPLCDDFIKFFRHIWYVSPPSPPSFEWEKPCFSRMIEFTKNQFIQSFRKLKKFRDLRSFDFPSFFRSSFYLFLSIFLGEHQFEASFFHFSLPSRRHHFRRRVFYKQIRFSSSSSFFSFHFIAIKIEERRR